jgi:hypothetical protein
MKQLSQHQKVDHPIQFQGRRQDCRGTRSLNSGRWFAGSARNCSSALLFALALAARGDTNAPSLTNAAPPEFLGLVTNQPAVFTSFRSQLINPTNGVVTLVTNRVFDHYFPDSLNHFVWTNFIARTNRRSTSLWSERSHPPDWPTNAPTLAWNTNSLVWGMKGLTALSPCWPGESASGQVPITALTRRHGYARGHGMGPEGALTNVVGLPVWFLTAENRRVTATIARAKVSLTHGDYTIFLFREDLPPGIEPLRVVLYPEFLVRYPFCLGAPRPLCQTEQLGHVNTGIPGFTVNVWKGGDSGSPDMLPLGNELVLYGGRSTGWPNARMQADMDALCILEGLDPKQYQLQWVDLAQFPAYPPR